MTPIIPVDTVVDYFTKFCPSLADSTINPFHFTPGITSHTLQPGTPVKFIEREALWLIQKTIQLSSSDAEFLASKKIKLTQPIIEEASARLFPIVMALIHSKYPQLATTGTL